MSDLRLLTKPSPYNENEWENWSCIFLAYFGAVDRKCGRRVPQCHRTEEAGVTAGMADEEQIRATTLYNMFVQVIQKRAFMTLKVTEPQNGGEAMRKLAEKRLFGSASEIFDLSTGDLGKWRGTRP